MLTHIFYWLLIGPQDKVVWLRESKHHQVLPWCQNFISRNNMPRRKFIHKMPPKLGAWVDQMSWFIVQHCCFVLKRIELDSRHGDWVGILCRKLSSDLTIHWNKALQLATTAHFHIIRKSLTSITLKLVLCGWEIVAKETNCRKKQTTYRGS